MRPDFSNIDYKSKKAFPEALQNWKDRHKERFYII